MSFLTIISIIVFVGYAVFSRVTTPQTSQIEPSPEVIGEHDTVSSSVPPLPTVEPSSSSKTSSTSQITINVDTDTNQSQSQEVLIYPGATSVSQGQYQTSTDPEKVYDWYIDELNKRDYSIRNNVKTRANDKFKAVLQAISKTSSIKVTIDQEQSQDPTLITIE